MLYLARMKATQSFAGVCLVLPDGKLVLQRRTQDAPYGAGMLGIFGGMMEPGESSEACIARELEEETSLIAKNLKLQLRTDFTLPASDDYPVDRHFYIYISPIGDASFDVYEGDGAEVYTKDELATRDDLSFLAECLFRIRPELLALD
jgi:8-oxo-dGTP pyrophosphatase MutT (NUDIX family)